MAEEEAEAELEAAIAVYGADCNVISRSPPHLLVRLQPRTADDISQQFVEAVLVIKANSQYPSEPPTLELKDVKGLEDGRVLFLLSDLRKLADELTSNPMLVAICEKALDRITEMNQPDGNCCFCMEPLVNEKEVSDLRPFMKLLSCFHCFHSDCFVRWWRWMLQSKNLDKPDMLLISRPEGAIPSCLNLLEEAEMKCPVCRESIDVQDMASIWNVRDADLGQEQDLVPDASVMFSKTEVERKAKFDELYREQQLCDGIIKPRKLEVIVPGMFVSVPSTRADEDLGLGSLTLQASEASSVLAPVVEQELSSRDTDNFRLVEQQAVEGGEDVGRASKSSGRGINPPTQGRGRRPNHAGGMRGHWVRRDHESSK